MATTPRRILLLVPPFASVRFPALAVHQLEAQLRAEGMSCDVCYSNAFYASMIGYDLYHEISWASPSLLLGERIFAAYLETMEHPGIRPGQRQSLIALCDDLADGKFPTSELAACSTVAFESQFRSTLELALLERDYDIVGLSCGCMQLCAAEYHAAIIRQLLPNCVIVVGGANCDGEMANGLLSFTKSIDFIFSGEADDVFPQFCREYPGGRAYGPIIRCDPIEDVSRLQPPDFSAYYSVLTECAYPFLKDTLAAYQSSRGCWWGEKSQCVFCGLNGATIRHRAKPVDKVLTELGPIMERHISRNLMMVDCIMPRSYLTSLLPRIRPEVGDLNIFYETKANLTSADVRKLRSSGICSIQPGIESLSSSLLKRMHKGVSGVNNLRLLVNCMRANIYPSWNILFGFPGDREEEYAEMLRAVPYLVHLTPPTAVSLISIDRFSPIFRHADAFGVSDIRPIPSYHDIFTDQVAVDKIGYHHIGTYESDSLNRPELRARIITAFSQWRETVVDRSPTLKMTRAGEGTTLVVDTRGTINDSTMFNLPSEVAELCFLIEDGVVAKEDVDPGALAELTSRGLILDYENTLINLVPRYSGADPAWEYDFGPKVQVFEGPGASTKCSSAH